MDTTKNKTHTRRLRIINVSLLDLSLALLLCSARKLFTANEKKIALFFMYVCVSAQGKIKQNKINNMHYKRKCIENAAHI